MKAYGQKWDYNAFRHNRDYGGKIKGIYSTSTGTIQYASLPLHFLSIGRLLRIIYMYTYIYIIYK